MNRRNLKFFLVVPMLMSSFPTETRADLITSLSVSVTSTGGGLEAYDYTLANLTQSTVSVYAFALSVDGGADLQSISSPTGWDVTYNAGDTSITWSAPTSDAAIAPGSSAFFSFISAEPPVLGDYQAIGFDPTNFQFYNNPGMTSVPGISSVPEPSAYYLARHWKSGSDRVLLVAESASFHSVPATRTGLWPLVAPRRGSALR